LAKIDSVAKRTNSPLTMYTYNSYHALKMNRYYMFGTFRDFWPKVCEDLQQKCSK